MKPQPPTIVNESSEDEGHWNPPVSPTLPVCPKPDVDPVFTLPQITWNEPDNSNSTKVSYIPYGTTLAVSNEEEENESWNFPPSVVATEQNYQQSQYEKASGTGGGGGIIAADVIPGGGNLVVGGGLCESLTSLDLSRNGLHDLPLALGRVHGLRFLEVAGNKLRTLFPALAPLRRLETLVASRNELQFCSLDLLLNNPMLRRLDVSNNYVSAAAHSFAHSFPHVDHPIDQLSK